MTQFFLGMVQLAAAATSVPVSGHLSLSGEEALVFKEQVLSIDDAEVIQSRFSLYATVEFSSVPQAELNILAKTQQSARVVVY